MPDGNSLAADLSRYVGQTVTIFTTSGGESGEGFTGVLALVTPNFVRLITQIGSAPGCALGNCCRPFHGGFDQENILSGERAELDGQGRASCRAITLGSVVDIPVSRIAAFVHNTVGSTF